MTLEKRIRKKIDEKTTYARGRQVTDFKTGHAEAARGRKNAHFPSFNEVLTGGDREVYTSHSMKLPIVVRTRKGVMRTPAGCAGPPGDLDQEQVGLSRGKATQKYLNDYQRAMTRTY